jgi:hypothetical protein
VALDQFEWREPPPKCLPLRQVHDETREVIEALKARPGEWAHMGDFPSNHAKANLRRYGVQMASRRRRDGRYDVWVRWPE